MTKSNSREFSTEMEDEELNEDFHEQELSNYVSQVIRHLGMFNYKIFYARKTVLEQRGILLQLL